MFPPPFLLLLLPGGCYLFLTSSPLTWEGARERCREEGGHLAEVLSLQEHQELVAAIAKWNATIHGFWIGLRDVNERKTSGGKGALWKWETSGIEANFIIWAKKQDGRAWQPNNSDGRSYFVNMWIGNDRSKPDKMGNWDDERKRDNSFGEPYGAICEKVEAKEYEEMAGMTWANNLGEESSLAEVESSSAADCSLRCDAPSCPAYTSSSCTSSSSSSYTSSSQVRRGSFLHCLHLGGRHLPPQGRRGCSPDGRN